MHRTEINVTTGEIVQIPYTAQEEAEWEAMRAAQQANPTPVPAPTKEQLMAELAALTAKIQALE